MSNILSAVSNMNQLDIVGSLARGQAAGQLQRDYANQNALRDTFAQHGAGAMQGDQNALAQIAAQDPGYAMELRGGNQRMDLANQANTRADASLGMDRERLEMARAQVREQSAARAAEAARQMNADQVAQRIAEGQRNGQMVAAALRQGPEAWDRLNDNIPGMADIPFEQAEMAIASIEGALEGFSAFGEAFKGDQPIKARPGDTFLDPNTLQTVGSVPEAPSFRDATPEEEARYGVPGQMGPDGRFHPINKPSGMAISSTPDGGLRFAQGPGVTASGGGFTEGQSKDNVYSTRARGALPIVDQYGEALLSRGQRAAEMDPTGFARELQTPEFQMAQQAGEEFLTAILRKDTGAAITSQEQQVYGSVYLPRPGDGPEVIAQKAQARQRAAAAIESGMSPAQMLAQENALKASGSGQPAGVPQVGEVVEGHVFNGGDPADPASWSKQ